MKKFIIPFAIVAMFAFYMNTSSVYSGEEKERVKFSHKLHVVEQEMACADCHAGAESSMSGKDNLLPAQSVCLECHEAGEVGDVSLYAPISDYSIKFSHQQHIESGADCESCHSAIWQKEVSVPYVLPTMVECMDCHESKAVSNECADCHMPFENLKPLSHNVQFKANHGDLARANAAEVSADMSCMVCHKQSYCQDCHEGENLDRLAHPLNYEFTHALEARSRENDCAVCHTEKQFCIACHQENNILPHNHTAGWVNNIPNDGGRHVYEARYDLENCAACHEANAEQICQPCHGQ